MTLPPLFLALAAVLILLSGCASAGRVFNADLRAERKLAESRLAQLSRGMSRREVARIIGSETAGFGGLKISSVTSLGRHETLILSEHFRVAAIFSVKRMPELLNPPPDEAPRSVDQMMGLAAPTEEDVLIRVNESPTLQE